MAASHSVYAARVATDTVDARCGSDRPNLLFGCMVAPGFEFQDFELVDRETLLAGYPAQHDLMLQYTRSRHIAGVGHYNRQQCSASFPVVVGVIVSHLDRPSLNDYFASEFI